MTQLGWVEVIIFYCISRAVDFQVSEGGYHAQGFYLGIDRQTAAESVQVVFVGALAFGFQKEHVLRFVGKGDQLGLYAWTVSRTNALYLSIEEWRVGQGRSQTLVNLWVGIGYPAGQLSHGPSFAHERELVEVVLAVLALHLIEVHAPAIYPHRCTCLHTSGGDAVSGDALGEVQAGWLGASSARPLCLADVHKPVEEGSCCDDYATRLDF